MLQTKKIMDKLMNFDKKIMISKIPSLIVITKNNLKEYKIIEYYNKNKHKELFYDNYNSYLKNIKFNKDVRIIINDLPVES